MFLKVSFEFVGKLEYIAEVRLAKGLNKQLIFCELWMDYEVYSLEKHVCHFETSKSIPLCATGDEYFYLTLT